MPATTKELSKAIQRLSDALAQEKNEFIRDSVIQRFEFCIELSWKTARKIMGTSMTAPKQVIREMAQNKLIDDVLLWLQAIDHRNLSTHIYNEDLAEQVYDFIKDFYPQFQLLLTSLKDHETL